MSIAILSTLMILGALPLYWREDGVGWGLIWHSFIVLVGIVLLWVYPKRETNSMKTTMVLVAFVYFYTLLLVYPETSSNLVLVCFLPGIAILFFLPRLVYLSLALNVFFLSMIFSYVALIDQGQVYQYLYSDLEGNIFNFFASQAVFFLIFYLSYTRIKKQQMYFEQIQQTERMKTTGQLAAAVAHEIRNPITVVKGFIQLYSHDHSLGEEKKKHFLLMLEELKVAETVITDFLSVANPKEGRNTVRINIKEALHDVVDIIDSFALLNNIMIDVRAQKCYVSCTPMEFKQLMINVIKNAIEASPSGEIIQITAREQKKQVIIDVIDQGKGMSKEELHSIGSLFYSLKSKGTGLGLMICQNIVQSYNGTLQFSSEKGKGTKATICFPSVSK
ncbi:sensor histidine kinase [Halalkalibacter krulwichiae]|nr:HAMP domain-containing sensor histidine kinase [Halalkalibacter krulwichiae]